MGPTQFTVDSERQIFEKLFHGRFNLLSEFLPEDMYLSIKTSTVPRDRTNAVYNEHIKNKFRYPQSKVIAHNQLKPAMN